MEYLQNIFFAIILTIGVGFFVLNIKKLYRNIKLGKSINRKDRKFERLKNMLMVAFGQSKMVKKPFSGLLHAIVYIGFIIINIEILEIIIDGLFGTHRVFINLFGISFYGFLIGTFEILAILVIASVLIFWIRRNIINIKRLTSKELEGWPKNDGNYILYFELMLMTLFLVMNATDTYFQKLESGNLVSTFLVPIFQIFSIETISMIERVSWWTHIIGILFFLNYLYYSKHLHILLAFPNTYYANLNPKGQLDNLKSVTKEVKLMLNSDSTTADEELGETPIEKFGASDVTDLNQVQLLNAYSCTECGRCTASCPANLTGKKLSPRNIMMKTRDRVEEVGINIDKNKGHFKDDGKKLINDYITPEEIWACTSCNACVEECPINIDPLSIIIDLRRYLVMEESSAPQELNIMMTNIENNGAPWQYSQQDRLKWIDEK